MTATHLEKIFFHNILGSKDYIHLADPRFFTNEIIRECFKVSLDFYNKYTQAPSREQLEELIKIKGLEEKITNDKLDIIYDVDLTKYDQDWITENIEAWIEYKNLDSSIFDLINYMQTTPATPENIKNIVNTAKSIILERNNLEFSFDKGLDFFDPDSHEQPISDTFTTGYPYLDLVTGGGFSIKTLWVVLGQAKVGKSIWLANLAASSVRSGYNTAYISLEMRDRKVVKRLGANLLGIKMSEYNKLAHDKVALKAKINNIGYETMKQPGQLYVKEFPTSTASVLDVERYLLKMEEMGGIKFKTVFIDYINIMKNWRNPNTENLYMKIKQIAEDMRAMAMRNDWAIVTATQVNRSGFDSTDLSMNNVSESAALIHTIDAMFGIIQDPIMHANREYILKLLANRDDGHKNAKRKFDINYDFMRITEDPNSEMWSDE
jgi:replicative DNA helicase